MVRTFVKDCNQTLKAGPIIIILVCYHLTISKMKVTGLVGHVSDLPISFLYVVLKKSLVTKEHGTIPVGNNMFSFLKITEQQPVIMSFF